MSVVDHTIVQVMVTCPRCEHTHTVEFDERELVPNAAEERVYLLQDLEDILKLSRRTIKQNIYDGRLKAYKPGRDRRWHVKESDLLAFRRRRGEL